MMKRQEWRHSLQLDGCDFAYGCHPSWCWTDHASNTSMLWLGVCRRSAEIHLSFFFKHLKGGKVFTTSWKKFGYISLLSLLCESELKKTTLFKLLSEDTNPQIHNLMQVMLMEMTFA